MIKYIKKTNDFTVPLFRTKTGRAKAKELLWGDRVIVLDDSGSRWKVRARGRIGFVAPSNLTNTSLLEFYFIDVGQGDGVLIRTPDHRHILIDGG